MNSILARIAVVAAVLTSSLQACIFTFVNDSNNRVMVVDMATKDSFDLGKGKQTVMGNPHERSHCCVYQKRGRNGKLHLMYEFKMISCAEKGEEPVVRVSELARGVLPKIFALVGTVSLSKSSSHCSKCSQR